MNIVCVVADCSIKVDAPTRDVAIEEWSVRPCQRFDCEWVYQEGQP